MALDAEYYRERYADALRRENTNLGLLAEALRENERLQAPVSDEEWLEACGFPIKEGAWVEWRNKIDALIANRAKPQKEEE